MYDGLAYAGSQFQENAPSIAGELQAVLAKRTQQDVRVVAAGRTDTGVHARGQAIHFDVAGERFGDDPEAFQRAVNSMLPHDVRLDHLERTLEHDAEEAVGALAAKGLEAHRIDWRSVAAELREVTLQRICLDEASAHALETMS